MSTEKILVGAAAGLVVGAAIGVLFAPHVGSTTRRRLSQKGQDYFDTLKKTFNYFVDEIAEKAEVAKKEAGNILEMGKNMDGQSVKGKDKAHSAH